MQWSGSADNRLVYLWDFVDDRSVAKHHYKCESPECKNTAEFVVKAECGKQFKLCFFHFKKNALNSKNYYLYWGKGTVTNG